MKILWSVFLIGLGGFLIGLNLLNLLPGIILIVIGIITFYSKEI